MSLIPEEHFTPRLSFNFAPMVDFLFIIIAVFAIVAITRKSLYDTHVSLVEQTSSHTSSAKPRNTMNLSISSHGEYKWLDPTETQILDSIETLKNTIQEQMLNGYLSSDPMQNQILLHIDQKAEWQPIAKLIYAMHEEGVRVYPIYEKKGPFTLKN